MEKAPDCAIFHCMIHRQALTSKTSDTLPTVAKVGKFIKSHPKRKIKHIKHYFYTRRCTGLCGAKCFLELRDKILEFLQNHDHTLSKQLTGVFWIKTAYLVDIFTLYNKTNRRLQCTESNILECKEAIDAFTRKL